MIVNTKILEIVWSRPVVVRLLFTILIPENDRRRPELSIRLAPSSKIYTKYDHVHVSSF